MTDKDYLEMARRYLKDSFPWERDYEDRAQDAAQVQAAALIAIAERLDDLSDLIFEMQNKATARK